MSPGDSQKYWGGILLVVQWLRLWAPNAGGSGSIPAWRTRPHILQLRPGGAKKKKLEDREDWRSHAADGGKAREILF